MKIVLIGGHHSSAIPVIKELQKSDSSLELVWFGHRNSTRSNKRESLEHKEITALGLKFYSLRAGKFYRTYNPISLLMIPLGFVHALLLLIKERPDAILTFGGYLSVPVVTVGWFLRIPSVLHEQTVVVGYANKFSSFFAKRVLLSWPDSIKFFNKKKVQVVGIPIRSEIFEASSASFICEPSLPVMYITAGKSGSNKINLLINSILEHLLDEVNIIHQCGDHSQFNDYDKLLNTYNNVKDKVRGKYFLRKFVFVDEIGEAYSRADFVLCRAGAHTVAELLALRKPAILIPIPWVSHNEQYENARYVQKFGLGVILDERNISPPVLLQEIKKFSENIKSYKYNDESDLHIKLSSNAAIDIAGVILEVAKAQKRKDVKNV